MAKRKLEAPATPVAEDDIPSNLWNRRNEIGLHQNFGALNKSSARRARKTSSKWKSKDGKLTQQDRESNVKHLKRYRRLAADLVDMFQRTPGHLLSFGEGEFGQLGNAAVVSAKRPRLVDTMENKKKLSVVACGGLHVAGLSEYGEVYTWGCNDEGSLGFDTGIDNEVFVPRHVDGFVSSSGEESAAEESIFRIAAGNCQTLALSHSGKVFMFGSYKDTEGKQWRDMPSKYVNTMTQKKEIAPRGPQTFPLEVHLLEKPAVQVACGASFNAALYPDGTVATWGIGQCGELARPVPSMKDDKDDYDIAAITEHYMTPKITKWFGGNAFKVERIACGNYHLLVIAENRGNLNVYTSGLNNYGQLGHGDIEMRHQLTLVNDLVGNNITHIDGGEHHTICMDEDGLLYSFGRGDSGQLGITDGLPASGFHKTKPEYIRLPQGVKTKSISCGDNHTLALTECEDVYSWGFGDTAALGHGVEEDSYKPRKVDLMRGLRKEEWVEKVVPVQVSGGGQYSCLISKLIGNEV